MVRLGTVVQPILRGLTILGCILCCLTMLGHPFKEKFLDLREEQGEHRNEHPGEDEANIFHDPSNRYTPPRIRHIMKKGPEAAPHGDSSEKKESVEP